MNAFHPSKVISIEMERGGEEKQGESAECRRGRIEVSSLPAEIRGLRKWRREGGGAAWSLNPSLAGDTLERERKREIGVSWSRNRFLSFCPPLSGQIKRSKASSRTRIEWSSSRRSLRDRAIGQ